MIKLNLIVILGIIVLLVLLYLNNSEHFAGAITQPNAEAIQNISSIVNSGNLRVTDINATGSLSVPSTTSANISTNNLAFGDVRIKKGEKTPDTLDIMMGDGTGWGVNFKKYNNTTVARIQDNGNLSIQGSATIAGDANITGNSNISGKLNVTGDITGTIKPNKGESKKDASEVQVNTGDWGSWQTPVYCPDNTYVCGLRIRYEGSTGGDDTALNAIKMQCCKF